MFDPFADDVERDHSDDCPILSSDETGLTIDRAL
jgi:hypothetical protein